MQVAPPPQGTLFGHPKALYVLFTTEMWERFNYYGLRAILILYMTKAVAAGGFGWDPSYANIIYGTFTGFVYITTIFGGGIADNLLGRRRSIFIGGLMMAVGQFTLAFAPPGLPFFLGLGMICLGNGLFKPNISTMVGSLYPPQDKRRDAAFTIFYMGINSGVIISLITGVLEEAPGYGARWGFGACGIAMLLGVTVMRAFGPRYLGQVGVQAEAREVLKQQELSGHKADLFRLTKVEWQRMFVLLVILMYATLFWMGFEQAGSSMNLFTRDYIDRHVFGLEIPTGVFQSVNSAFVVTLGPLFAWLWVRLARSKREPRTPVKMGIALILVGIGFLCLVAAVLQRGGDVPDTAIKASLHWLVLAYMFHTMGELCLSPVGLSVFTKLAPPQFGSLLMGSWFLAVGLANFIGGFVAASVASAGAYLVFSWIAWLSISMGVVALVVSPVLSKLMHGVN